AVLPSGPHHLPRQDLDLIDHDVVVPGIADRRPRVEADDVERRAPRLSGVQPELRVDRSSHDHADAFDARVMRPGATPGEAVAEIVERLTAAGPVREDHRLVA